MPRQIASKWRPRFCTDRLPGLDDRPRGGRPAHFPPNVVVAIKALACELPSRHGLPLARWSVAELRQEAVACGIVAQISGTTLWRWLGQDALRPWRHRSWIFPRDPHFASKAGRISDLYRRRWKGEALGPRDYVLRIDEKTSIQAMRRKHPSSPQRQGTRATSSTSMLVPVRWLTLPRGTCIEPDCSAAANARTVSRHSTASSAKSWARNVIGQPAACF
jgi:hypothetical protein